jgi:hypothetical protein
MKNFQLNRLLKLADFLDTLRPSQFDLSEWVSKVDVNGKPVVCCAIGWAAMLPEFRKRGLKLRPVAFWEEYYTNHPAKKLDPVLKGYTNWDAIEKFFGVTNDDDLEYLFYHKSYPAGERTKPQTVARRLREFVAGVEADKSLATFVG